MSTAENKRDGNLAVSDERCTEVEDETLERKLFGLALTLATEPSKLGHVRQMLVQFQEQRGLPEDLSSWAIGHIDERVMSMALAYAHDAEVLVQMLSFKGGTFDSLIQAIEDMYQQEQISQRIYVKAKLLLRAHEPPKPEKPYREAQQQPAAGSHSTASPGLEQALIEMLATVSIPIIVLLSTPVVSLSFVHTLPRKDATHTKEYFLCQPKTARPACARPIKQLISRICRHSSTNSSTPIKSIILPLPVCQVGSKAPDNLPACS